MIIPYHYLQCRQQAYLGQGSSLPVYLRSLLKASEATQRKCPIDCVALGVPRWSQMYWQRSWDAWKCQHLPCKLGA